MPLPALLLQRSCLAPGFHRAVTWGVILQTSAAQQRRKALEISFGFAAHLVGWGVGWGVTGGAAAL